MLGKVRVNTELLEAVQGVSAERFGGRYLSDDLAGNFRVFGARLTGGGVGGTSVALVEVGKVDAISRDVLERYMRSGYVGRILVSDVS